MTFHLAQHKVSPVIGIDTSVLLVNVVNFSMEDGFKYLGVTSNMVPIECQIYLGK